MHFLRSFSITSVSTVVVYSLGFVNHSLLARHMDPVDYGDLAFWITTVMFITLAVGEWLSRGNTYFVGRYQRGETVFANTLVYGTVLIGLGGSIYLLWLAYGKPEILVPALLALALALSTALQKSGLGIALGLDRIKLYAAIPLVFIVIYLGGNILLAWSTGLTLARVMAVWLGATAAAAITILTGLWLGTGNRIFTDRAVFAATARIGWRGALSYLLIFLLFRGNVWIIEYLLDATHQATYRVVTNFADVIQHLPNVAGIVLLAKVVRGQDEAAELSFPVARAALVFAIGCAVSLVLLGPKLIDVFFPLYPGAYSVLLWLLPGLVFTSFGSIFNTKLAGLGYPPVTLWAPAMAVPFCLALNFLLIPRFGLIGAALGNTLAYGMWAIVVSNRYLRYSGLSWAHFLRP